MANIVSIDTGTFNEEKNEIGDIVSVHNDDVKLDGSGYAAFKITHVTDMTAKEVMDKLNSLIPEVKSTYQSKTTEWTLVPPIRKTVWMNAFNDWVFIEKQPKYAINLSLTTKDLEDLAKSGVTVSKTVKESILSKCTEKISADPTNQVKATDLNKVVAEIG